MLRYAIDSLDQEIAYEMSSLVALQAMIDMVDAPCAAPMPVRCEEDFRRLN
jgi:hypothetical protein